MEKKRSKGVTFWGWIFIIFSVIGFLTSIKPQPETQIYGVGIRLFSIVSCVAYLICGIFILKLNETARKVAIILGIISILSIPVYIKPLLKIVPPEDYYTKAKQKITEEIKPEYQQRAFENLEKSREAVTKVLPVFIIVLVGIPFLILELIPIYLFTRPKVKEQFKNNINTNHITRQST